MSVNIFGGQQDISWALQVNYEPGYSYWIRLITFYIISYEMKLIRFFLSSFEFGWARPQITFGGCWNVSSAVTDVFLSAADLDRDGHLTYLLDEYHSLRIQTWAFIRSTCGKECGICWR